MGESRMDRAARGKACSSSNPLFGAGALRLLSVSWDSEALGVRTESLPCVSHVLVAGRLGSFGNPLLGKGLASPAFTPFLALCPAAGC